MTTEQIIKQINQTEDTELEYKSAKGGFRKKLFMFLGNGEKAGSGADIIKKGWRDNKWPQPVLSERVQPNESILTLSVGDVGENVTKDVTKELTDRQKIILEIIKENSLVTIPEMSLKTGVTTRTIKRDIEDLQSWGILFRKGGRKDGEWIIKTTD
jgi:predicted HTH transcriptional regulator